MQIRLRQPCRLCQSTDGRTVTKGGQDVVYCAHCGCHAGYNAPKSETGRAPRSLRTRPDIKPSQRSRILDRDGGRCCICHHANRDLDIAHLVSVDDGRTLGMTEAELYDDENLVAMCAPCNSGYGSMSVSPRVLLMLIRARIARRGAA